MKKYPYIMVVDDEQAILRMLSRTLEPEGYGVILADNGSSALARIRAKLRRAGPEVTIPIKGG